MSFFLLSLAASFTAFLCGDCLANKGTSLKQRTLSNDALWSIVALEGEHTKDGKGFAKGNGSEFEPD